MTVDWWFATAFTSLIPLRSLSNSMAETSRSVNALLPRSLSEFCPNGENIYKTCLQQIGTNVGIFKLQVRT
jgi:hypothetical protein